jgi:hypothetical protein
MKYSEIIKEMLSMSELDDLRTEIRSLQSVVCSIDKDDQRKNQIWIIFELHGHKGYMVFESIDTKSYNKKIWAAARSQLGKEPKSWTSALNTVKGNIRNNAIKILTNPESWKVVDFKYQSPNIKQPEKQLSLFN